MMSRAFVSYGREQYIQNNSQPQVLIKVFSLHSALQLLIAWHRYDIQRHCDAIVRIEMSIMKLCNW